MIDLQTNLLILNENFTSANRSRAGPKRFGSPRPVPIR
jgi:hypothetical protein